MAILTFAQAFTGAEGGGADAPAAAAEPMSFQPNPTTTPQPQMQPQPQPQPQTTQQPQVMRFENFFQPQQDQEGGADTAMGGGNQPLQQTGVPTGQPRPAGPRPTGQTPQGPTGPDDFSLASQANSWLQQGGKFLNEVLPGATKNLGGTGINLSDISGPLGLATGIAHGNVGQAVGGGLQTAATAARLLDMPGVSATLGNLGGPLSLAMGIQSGDPMGIASGVIGTYGAIANLSSLAASSGLINFALPTLGEIGASIASGLGLSFASAGAPVAGGAAGLGAGVAAGAATGVGSTAGALAATIGPGLTAGIVMAPIAIGLIVKSISDMREAEVLKRRVATAKKDMQTVIPQTIDTVRRDALPTFQTINDPNATPEQVRAAYDKAKAAVDLYNTYDNYFKTGKGAYGAVDLPQLKVIAKSLEPHLNTLSLGMLRATDRLAGTALEPKDRYSDPASLAFAYGVNANDKLRPMSMQNAAVAGGGAQYQNVQDWLLAHPEHQQNFVETPYGTMNSALYEQVKNTLKPGQLEQGLKTLAGNYGAVPAGMLALGFGSVGKPLAVAAEKLPVPEKEYYAAVGQQITQQNQWYQALAYQDFTSGGGGDGGGGDGGGGDGGGGDGGGGDGGGF